MSGKEKQKVIKDKQSNPNNAVNQSGDCPKKEGDNCLIPGVYNDSDPIGGS